MEGFLGVVKGVYLAQVERDGKVFQRGSGMAGIGSRFGQGLAMGVLGVYEVCEERGCECDGVKTSQKKQASLDSLGVCE